MVDRLLGFSTNILLNRAMSKTQCETISINIRNLLISVALILYSECLFSQDIVIVYIAIFGKYNYILHNRNIWSPKCE